jgi:hypothetical protein
MPFRQVRVGQDGPRPGGEHVGAPGGDTAVVDRVARLLGVAGAVTGQVREGVDGLVDDGGVGGR